MKALPCSLAVVALSGGLLASCAPPPIVKVPVSTSNLSDKSPDGRLLAEVNAYRNSTGHQSLVRNATLDRMAREHSEFLRANRGKFNVEGSNISHFGFEGRALRARAQLSISSLAENVASGKNASMPLVVKMWAASKGHDFNMRGDWTETGVGVAVDQDGTVFATQLFGSPHTSTVVMDDPFRQH